MYALDDSGACWILFPPLMTKRKTTSREGPEERKQKFSTSSPPPATPTRSSIWPTVSGTPLRTHNNSFMHEGHTPPTSHQADLKKVMQTELGDQTWQLPLDRVANVEEILHGGNCCRGRASQVTRISFSVPENVISNGFMKAAWPKRDLDPSRSSVPEARMLNVCGDKFVTSQHHYFFPANHSRGIPASNDIVLPTEMELKKGVAEFHWNLLNPLVLFTAILHAMLGWLAICQEALQHRDVSVGNVLRLSNPVEMPSFKFESDIADLMGTLSLLETLPFTVTDQITRLKSSLAELKVNTRCSGFMIDGDMAVDWKTYFDANHDGTRSGTPEFMSVTLLRESLYSPMTYVQSTVDDLASFYYVGQWAAVFNPSHQSDMLEELRNRIAGSLASREFATRIVHRLIPDLSSHRREYGLFLQCCQPILKEWCDSIDSLDRRFLRVTEELTAHSEDGKIDPNTYRSLFLSFSYHGVADFAQILERHGASLASYDKLNS
ncbi:hypothetical protein C8J55DRAFT_159824 [Lentinula edodes]|uniref:Fungal-type protein kinase domain-containing protein n=1 Tax=Lentinula lateritia TaxID=40482 RepID=A0A9W9AY97_9AGAR|nr:hypothetical protein C8J55DRAFT_159824 [Lentinula edodes]